MSIVTCATRILGRVAKQLMIDLKHGILVVDQNDRKGMDDRQYFVKIMLLNFALHCAWYMIDLVV